MSRALTWLPAGLLVALAAGVLMIQPTRAGEIGYAEDYALARDRAAALRQLIPGSEDFYYYHCLHYLNTEQFDKVVEMTGPWYERFRQSPRLTEIQTRHALLTYEKNPKGSLAYLSNRLGLGFNHQKEVVGAAPNLPTSLDPNLISRNTQRAHSYGHWGNTLANFEESALDWLAAEDLTWERRRELLSRLNRPDVPNLPKLVFDDLTVAPHPQSFGAYPVHAMMTLPQLEALLKLKPDLLNQTAFANAWIAKLQPGADSDWRRDRKLARAYLERLEAFVMRLAPTHNGLKAHVLYHRLALDRADGIYDKARFIEYLKLPRHQPYMSKALLEREDSHRHPADLNGEYLPVTLLVRVGPDEGIVKSYLKHFFVDLASPKEFEPYINDVYLKHLFAETKVEHGLGEPEVWASQLPPDLFAQLKDRVDIDFAHTNKTDFAADEPVKLDLFVKNVPNLLVKVFEVNTVNFYRTQLREVDTDINLDGLVANVEQTNPYADPPLRRMPRKFEFPQLSKPGVYVIDFIGNGKSSRALVRKGKLRPVVAPSTAGQRVTVVDDANKPVPDAAVWLAGAEYRADKNGIAMIPFTAQPGRRPIVLTRGDFASLDTFEHLPENYALVAGIHIDRESLLPQRLASILVRPALYLNGQPVSIKLLEDVRLRITSVDMAGIASSTEVPEFRLFEDRESVHEIRTPSRLMSLNVALTAKVKSLSQGKPVDLAAAQNFQMNEIERTDRIEDLHLAKFGADYTIEVLGRTGESKVDRPVHFSLKHRDFKAAIAVTLKTDPAGRIKLGPLPDITSVTATGPESTSHTWNLPFDRHTYRAGLHAIAGQTVTVPYLGSMAKADRSELALFEVVGDAILADKFESIGLKDGLVELNGLTPGDYVLWLKRQGERIRIRVTDGPIIDNNLLGKLRHLQLPGLKPTQIASVVADDKTVKISLKDANPFARVHVFATRYEPAFDAFNDLGRVRDAGLSGVVPTRPESVYLTGRNIGDEYRYVLDRRGMKKHPGNMLERPMLLLNPWAVRSTDTAEQLAQGGDDFAARGTGAPSAVISPAAKPQGDSGLVRQGGDFANLDYLADASAVVLNLVPENDGTITLDRARLGPHAMITVVAVDPLTTTQRTVSLPEVKAAFLDLRLKDGLDPNGHFTQQKQVTALAQGQPFVVADIGNSRFEAYDSLGKVYALYATLTKNPHLAEFAFLSNWPKLKPDEKKALYSKYACHELSFFIFKKDPDFFAGVVKPYLANKKDKTFLDHWLLSNDVNGFLDPWSYGRLNTAERVFVSLRIPGEPAKTSRHLDDLLKLTPPNVERHLMLFDTALQSSSLSTNDSLGLLREQKEVQKLEEFAKDPKGGFAPGDMGATGGGAGGLGAPKAARPGASPPPAGPAGAPGKDDAEKKARDGLTKREAADKDMKEAGGRRGGEGENFYKEDRKEYQVRQLYRRLDPTKEWAENNYYHLRIHEQIASLVAPSQFWLDYAKHDGKAPFLSRNLADASRNFTEMVLALAVLDLPFEAGKHEVKFDAGKMTLTPASAAIAFHEEVRKADAPDGKVPVLIGQNYYRHGDRFREENGEKTDKYVTGEFLIHTVYGCQVVVTNPTSSRQRLSVLVQLPVGAMPLAGAQVTRAVPLDLEPYRTVTVDYLFYFPGAGKFSHFPAHVAKSERVVAAVKPTILDVVRQLSRPDTESWDYVSQNGTPDEVIAMMNRENVNALNLDKVAFRLRDKAFFDRAIVLLKDRHVYHNTTWSYAVHHNATAVAKEFFSHAEQIVNEVGGPIDTALLTVDPVLRHQYEHLEYKPLVNARAHALGNRRQIVNAAVYEQYHRLLKTLTYRKTLDDSDLLATTYYLLLQDRIDEAQAAFARVSVDRVATRMQYDYCAAYLAMFDDEPDRARAIADRYADHPVDRWRNTFTAVRQHLDEAQGKAPKVVDGADPAQNQGQLAATEPGFEVALDGKGVAVTWQNLPAVTVNYYLMDVELLFSRSPFAQQGGGQFAFTKPNSSQEVKLVAGQQKVSVPLPENLQKRNVLVEVTGAGKTRSVPYFAAAMNVAMTENYGQVKVVDPNGSKPLAKVYVKVYAKLADGSVKFHKDGYTDLRGRFDYVSVNTPERQAIQRFSVLVLSDDRGAVIREAAPPQQ